MEANKDDALKCLKKAKDLLNKGDVDGARRLANKSKKMYSTRECDEFLNQLTNMATDDTPTADSAHSNRSTSQNTANQSTEESEHQQPPKKSYTPQQEELVNKILKCKDYYDILGVSKDASEDDLKKSYKKLALKLHPDKNNAPKADDAFKAVSRAYEVLNDETKRNQYDQFGEDGLSNHHNHTTFFTRRRGGGFDEFDLFREMFGENPFRDNFSENVYYTPSGQTYVFRQPFRNFTARTPQHAQSPFFLFLFFIPVFVFFVSFLFMPSSPYSMYRTTTYSVKKQVIKTDYTIDYYVKTSFDQDYPNKSQKSEIERMVIRDHSDTLWERCSQDMFFRSRTKPLPNSCKRYELVSGRKIRTR